MQDRKKEKKKKTLGSVNKYDWYFLSQKSLNGFDWNYWSLLYSNDPKFLDRYVWANSADPDQRSSLIRVYTVCHSVCIVQTHNPMVEPHSSNFRVITTNFLGVWIFRKFTVYQNSSVCSGCLKACSFPFEPRHEKTCLWDLWPGKTQTGLRSHRS